MYIGNAKVEHNMEYIFTNQDIKLSKEQFEYLTDRYNRAIRMEKKQQSPHKWLDFECNMVAFLCIQK